MLQYTALVRKDEGTDYWVDIPDIPGCVAAGETVAIARARFASALQVHLQAMRRHGRSPAPPRSREAVLAAEDTPYEMDYVVEIDSIWLEGGIPDDRLRS